MFLPCVHELWTNWRRSLFPDRRRHPSHGPWLHWIRQWRLALGWLRPPRRQTRIWTRSFGRRGQGGWTGPGCHTSPATTAPWDQQPWTAGGGWVHWEDHPEGKTINYLWCWRTKDHSRYKQTGQFYPVLFSSAPRHIPASAQIQPLKINNF